MLSFFFKFFKWVHPCRYQKSFWIRGNGSKIWGNGPKIWGNRSTNWDFIKFLKKAETDQKYDENLRKPISKMRFFKNAETDQNYEETDLNIGKRIQNIWKSLNNYFLLCLWVELFPWWVVSTSQNFSAWKCKCLGKTCQSRLANIFDFQSTICCQCSILLLLKMCNKLANLN